MMTCVLRKTWIAALVACASVTAAAMVACDDAPATVAPPASDAGTADPSKKPPKKTDGGTDVDPEETETDAGDAGKKPPRAAPVFLAAADYADWIAIDSKFPFDVTQKHAASKDIGAAHWGRHGGPVATTGVYGSSGPAGPKVTRWSVGGGPTAAATKVDVPITKATGLPAQFFYGADGMLDAPFGALLSYSTGGAPFAGEALLYADGYDTVKSRAKVNGFYSGVGLRRGTSDVLVYSGLSPVSATAAAGSDNGVYAAPLCAGALTGAAPCAASHKLFDWNGNSGPVVSDAHGNVFVGAALSSADTSDEVYALTSAQAFGTDEVTPFTLAAVDSIGTASLAAIAPEGSGAGWVVGLGYAEDAAVYGASYNEGTTAIVKGGDAFVSNAIRRGTGVDSIYVFTDAEGDLWLALTKGDEGVFLELRRK